MTDPLAPPPDLRAPPDDAERSPEGLVSKVLRAGTGQRSPRPFDRVRIHFTAWTPRGALSSSSHARGAPAVLRPSDVAPGFSLGLQRMVVGEKRRLWIPKALADTRRAAEAEASVVDVELLELLPGVEPRPAPPDLGSPSQNAQRTPSGLIHELLVPSDAAARPRAHDRVRVVYAGWSRDGRLIDSSQPRGDFVEMPVSQGFPGFREALSILRQGEKRRFWFPAALAYGAYPGGIEGPLVFDIELLSIVEMPSPPPAPADAAAVPKSASRTQSGLAYRVLRAGSGTRRPSPRSAVEVHYTLWRPDGELVDSTVPSGQPQRAELKGRDLPPGLTEAVQHMVVGERRRLWMPATLGYAGQLQPGSGRLVCDLELLAIYEGKVQVDIAPP